MTRTDVTNASPLISLARAGALDLLLDPEADLLIPEPVASEVLAGPAADPARQALERGWGRRIPVEVLRPAVLEWSLGRGESAVLTLAADRPGSVAILDDAAARRCARALGIPVMGTLGVVLRARRAGRIPSAGRVLRDLRGAGLHLDNEVIRHALATVAGETWDG